MNRNIVYPWFDAHPWGGCNNGPCISATGRRSSGLKKGIKRVLKDENALKCQLIIAKRCLINAQN